MYDSPLKMFPIAREQVRLRAKVVRVAKLSLHPREVLPEVVLAAQPERAGEVVDRLVRI